MLINRLRFARPIQSFILPKESLFFSGGRGGGKGSFHEKAFFKLKETYIFLHNNEIKSNYYLSKK